MDSGGGKRKQKTHPIVKNDSLFHTSTFLILSFGGARAGSRRPAANAPSLRQTKNSRLCLIWAGAFLIVKINSTPGGRVIPGAKTFFSHTTPKKGMNAYESLLEAMEQGGGRQSREALRAECGRHGFVHAGLPGVPLWGQGAQRLGGLYLQRREGIRPPGGQRCRRGRPGYLPPGDSPGERLLASSCLPMG